MLIEEGKKHISKKDRYFIFYYCNINIYEIYNVYKMYILKFGLLNVYKIF